MRSLSFSNYQDIYQGKAGIKITDRVLMLMTESPTLLPITDYRRHAAYQPRVLKR